MKVCKLFLIGKLILISTIAIVFIGCQSNLPQNYNLPMSRDVIEKVKVGMNQTTVRGILGSPKIVDVFHPRMWVYLFLSPQSEPWQLIVLFDEQMRVEKTTSRLANVENIE